MQCTWWSSLWSYRLCNCFLGFAWPWWWGGGGELLIAVWRAALARQAKGKSQTKEQSTAWTAYTTAPVKHPIIQ
jgi:hypothetical protein